MLYQSTRGGTPADGPEAVLRGIAPDGGLYVDASLGKRPFPWDEVLCLPPLSMAARIMGHLLPDFGGMDELLRNAWPERFDSPVITPLASAGDFRILELFHGPTCAFKDVALSVLPLLMTKARAGRGEAGQTLILTATSGDTGKAALEGFRDVDGTGIVVFFPDGGVSPVQRMQMVTQAGENVRVCAVSGNFDDCQSGVKKAFAALNESGEPARRGMVLSSANSINIGRLAPQTVYYFLAYRQLMDRDEITPGDPVDFVVPTGNFGDILAGYQAKLMGLPVGHLVCASNANRVLTDFFAAGIYDRRREFLRTASPSMDILISSNLERLLYLASDGAEAFVSACMNALVREGSYTVPEEIMARIREDFAAGCCSEEECARTIGKTWRECGYLADPHTAVALKVTDEWKASGRAAKAVVTLSTASPFKFPAAVLAAVGGEARGSEFDQMRALSALSGLPVPPSLSGLSGKAVRFKDVIAPEKIGDYVHEIIRKGGV